MLLLILLFGHILTVFSKDRHPSISQISQEKYVDLGDRLELICQVEDAEQYSVNWMKISRSGSDPSNYIFITKGQQVVAPDNRYHVLFDRKRSAFVLTIDSIKENDAGTYMCQIVTSTIIDAKVNVTVRIPPVISDNSTRSVLTSVGSNVELNCYSYGYPQPSIAWRREKYVLIPNNRGASFKGNKLAIYNVTKNDRGTYYCFAYNGVEPSARRAISVEVEFPPVIKVGRKRYGQALQYYADMYCDIEAFPSPSIHWVKDGVLLNDDQYYQISIFAKNDEFSGSILRVKRIESKQYGNYQCRAANKLGTSEETIVLYETVNVICPPACDVTETSHSNKLSPVFTLL
ncbi:lachesin-like protein 4, partial [Leptotrombidium deliense]